VYHPELLHIVYTFPTNAEQFIVEASGGTVATAPKLLSEVRRREMKSLATKIAAIAMTVTTTSMVMMMMTTTTTGRFGVFRFASAASFAVIRSRMASATAAAFATTARTRPNDRQQYRRQRGTFARESFPCAQRQRGAVDGGITGRPRFFFATRTGAKGPDSDDGDSVGSSTSSEMKTSYEVDGFDQDAEQHLRTSEETSDQSTPINGGSAEAGRPRHRDGDATLLDRYQNVLEDVGLGDGQLQFARKLSPRRTVSPYGIFCNRELRFSGIRAIGFDMDYTLAQYQQPAFDKLAFDGAKEKLFHNLGYPEEVLDFEYDHEHWTRGLIIDTLRGNFLKIDRHKYVRVAYHGFDKMSSTTRKLLYSRTFNKVMSFSEKHFVNMDTLFQFVDAHLFACLIDLKDKGQHEFLDFRTYDEMYRHVRECVDLCHRDGVIKDEVARDPSKYVGTIFYATSFVSSFFVH